LPTASADDVPTSWSHDGKNILFMRFQNDVPGSVWVLSLADHETKPLLQSSSFEQAAADFSPDGRFIAYDSTESGRLEVYVQTFPLSGQKWMISAGGGTLPRWREDGKELFYLTPDGKVMSAEFKSGFENIVTKQLFQVDMKHATGYPYAVTADGSRFLINTPAEASNPAPMVVVLNWPATLKQ
jgi:Tol biopolymer transport system component